MTPPLMILFAWLLFGASHILLSSKGISDILRARFGPERFLMLYTAVTTLTLVPVIVVVAFYGDQGSPGPAHFGSGTIWWGLAVLSFGGAAMAASGLVGYPRSFIFRLAGQRDVRHPMAHKPTVVERMARHPFFAGLTIFATAHALIADTLVVAVFFAGFAVLAFVGMPMQDRKLRHRWQASYEAFEAQTALVPFSAVRSEQRGPPGINKMEWMLPLGVGLIVPGLGHPIWSLGNGAGFGGFVLMFGLIGVGISLSRMRAL